MNPSSDEPSPFLHYELVDSDLDENDGRWNIVDAKTNKTLVTLDQPDLVKAFMAGYRAAKAERKPFVYINEYAIRNINKLDPIVALCGFSYNLATGPSESYSVPLYLE